MVFSEREKNPPSEVHNGSISLNKCSVGMAQGKPCQAASAQVRFSQCFLTPFI